MARQLNHLAFVLCLVPVVIIVTGMLKPSRTAQPARPMTREEFRAQNAATSGRSIFALLPLACGAAGALILLVDAFRREYDQPKGVPVALAIVGVISFGLTSIVYYAFWGHKPTRDTGPRLSDFCAACRDETLDKQSPGTSTINGFFGTRLIGSARRCTTCGSTVKTLWIIWGVPLVPLGSYRVLPAGEATFDRAWFLSRKTTSMHWAQVLAYLLVTAAVAGFIAYNVAAE